MCRCSDTVKHTVELLRKIFIRFLSLISAETVEITYSFWDGSGHRRKVLVSYLR